VAELRRQAAAKQPIEGPSTADRIADFDKRFTAMLGELETILRKGDENGIRLMEAVDRMSARLLHFREQYHI